MKFMEQLDEAIQKGGNNMKITKEKLLKAITLVDQSTNTIITADEVYDDNVGIVTIGFNMKARMPENEFKEAMDSGNPGEYILAHYPADGTIAEGRLERLSIDETLSLVNGPSSNFYVLFWRLSVFMPQGTFTA